VIHVAPCKALCWLWWHICAFPLSTGSSKVTIPWGNSAFPGTCSECGAVRLLVLEQCWWRGRCPDPMQAQLCLADLKHFLHLLVSRLSTPGTSRGSAMGINAHPLRHAPDRGWAVLGRAVAADHIHTLLKLRIQGGGAA